MACCEADEHRGECHPAPVLGLVAGGGDLSGQPARPAGSTGLPLDTATRAGAYCDGLHEFDVCASSAVSDGGAEARGGVGGSDLQCADAGSAQRAGRSEDASPLCVALDHQRSGEEVVSGDGVDSRHGAIRIEMMD